MSLATYRKKRNFKRTPEPEGKTASGGSHRFVVQEHHASTLHFDFRLEMGGVLKSWAVPKGPSMDPRQKRLAVEVEDHPIDYIDFEGEIKEGNYGAGQVAVWDCGEYELLDDTDPLTQYEDGKLSFILHGGKLRGQFNLIKMQNHKNQWLLIKSDDESAESGWELEQVIGDQDRGEARTAAKPKMSSRKVTSAVKRRSADLPSRKRKLTGSLEFRQDGKQITITGLDKTPMPQIVNPMLATLVDKPFSDAEWLFEYKWDGVRAICYLKDGKAHFVSRHGKEMGFRYPELASVTQSVQAKQAILDGEIVALDERGRPDFQLLQSRIGVEAELDIKRLSEEHPVVYYAFDLLYYNGFNLMPAPLEQRKALLEAIISANGVVRFSSHVLGDGEGLFRQVQAAKLEGVVAKHRLSGYVQRRSSRWLKLKTVMQQEVVIGGYTRPRRTREFFGALVVGLYRDDHLVFVGHVGGGFNRKLLDQIYRMMQPLKTRRSPFADVPSTNEPVQWLKPKLVAQVKFAGWTTDKQMRQPIFLGLRDDKEPKDCVLEEKQPVDKQVQKVDKKVAAAAAGKPNAKQASGPVVSLDELLRTKTLEGDIQVQVDDTIVSLTSLDKPYWPEEGLTKGDLVRYYASVSDYLLPYLRDRPLILKRYPNGIDAPFFFQHDLENAPDFVRTETLEVETGRQIDYAVIDNLQTLLYLTNLGTIEQHPWTSRIGDLDHPDWVVFDLDPGNGEIKVACEVALAVRETLAKMNLPAYAKTSGSRGMHVFLPVKPVYSFEEIARFAELVATRVAAENPELATVERSLQRRQSGLVYVDHMQNARGKSIAAPYSARARRGATVSTPLTWKEVAGNVAVRDFTILTLNERLKRKGDIFQPVLEEKANLGQAMKRMEQTLRPKLKLAR